jgi:CubicO group peptidase (beta-lactamase class C family)
MVVILHHTTVIDSDLMPRNDHRGETKMDLKQNSRAQPSVVLARVPPFVRGIVECFGAAGLALGIVKGDELIYAQGFGVRNLETGEPVTPRSLFHLASISKTFVATALMQLVEAGQLELDTPVVAYLPYFGLNDERAARITLQQMLSHTSELV